MENKNRAYALNIIDMFVREIAEKYHVEYVYLYGSYCYGNPGKDSDIDVAVILNESIDIEKDFDIFQKAQKINLDLEAVVFTLDEFNQDASDLVVEIKNKGEKVA